MERFISAKSAELQGFDKTTCGDMQINKIIT